MFLSKYGVARHIYIPVVKRAVVDFAVGADWTPAAGDVKISKDGGAAANVTNLPAAIAMGNGAVWDFSLTATEMQAAQVVVTVADSATKAVEDQSFIIETHGNASAQFQVDLADSVRAGLTALPNATVSGVGGLLTAPTTANVGLADLSRILGTALTETAGLLAGGFKKFFNVATPAATMDHGVLVDTVTTYTGNTVQTGDAYARLGAPAGASHAADVAGVKVDTAAVKVQTDKLTFTVANQVDSNVKSNAGTAITAAAGVQEVKVQSIAANAITATSIAADAITDAKVASDVTIASVTGAVGSVTGAVGSVTGAVGSVTGAVGSVTGNVGGNVTGSVGSLATQAKADVNAEVVDALATDTYAEPGQGTPAATASLSAKIGYLYKAWRNKKTQTATTFDLFNDAGSVVDQKSTVSDDGTTATRGLISSGP